MNELLLELSKTLVTRQLKLVTVESCTGGWIGKTVTDIAGSSSWFEAGFITYTNESKNRLVNVPMSLCDEFGAVSIEVANAMASGANAIFPRAIAVSVTGCAGPGGGSETKPVGTVCIAVCLHGQVNSQRFLFKGNREQVRRSSVIEALKMVMDVLAVK